MPKEQEKLTDDIKRRIWLMDKVRKGTYEICNPKQIQALQEENQGLKLLLQTIETEIDKLSADFKEQKTYGQREGYVLNHLRFILQENKEK
jgi:hypothetical protein